MNRCSSMKNRDIMFQNMQNGVMLCRGELIKKDNIYSSSSNSLSINSKNKRSNRKLKIVEASDSFF